MRCLITSTGQLTVGDEAREALYQLLRKGEPKELAAAAHWMELGLSTVYASLTAVYSAWLRDAAVVAFLDRAPLETAMACDLLFRPQPAWPHRPLAVVTDRYLTVPTGAVRQAAALLGPVLVAGLVAKHVFGVGPDAERDGLPDLRWWVAFLALEAQRKIEIRSSFSNDSIRGEKQQVELWEAEFGEPPLGERDAERSSLRAAIRQHANLKDRELEILIRHEVHGETFRKIGNDLNISHTRVRQINNRARQQIAGNPHLRDLLTH